jgi:5-methyltetrahydrofolate--homocysteine methyltransferase
MGGVNVTTLARLVFEGDKEQVASTVKNMIEGGKDAQAIVDELIEGMNEVGMRFKNGDMFVPEVLMSADAMHEGISLVQPLLVGHALRSLGTAIIGTVRGDLHDIGKNLVCMMLESSGFKVIDAGIDVTPEQFVSAVKEHKPAIVGMSALLTTTMMTMKDTVDLLTEEGLREGVKIVIGGAPVSRSFSTQIGADGYAPDAASAVDVCKSLVS